MHQAVPHSRPISFPALSEATLTVFSRMSDRARVLERARAREFPTTPGVGAWKPIPMGRDSGACRLDSATRSLEPVSIDVDFTRARRDAVSAAGGLR
jgi:hypothetical protein